MRRVGGETLSACNDSRLDASSQWFAVFTYFWPITKFTVALPLGSTETFLLQSRGGVNTGRSTRLVVKTSNEPSWRATPQPSCQATISYCPGGTFVSLNSPLSSVTA